MDNNQELSQKDIKRLELAVVLSKEVVYEADFPNAWNYVENEKYEQGYRIYKRVKDDNVLIFAEVKTEFGIVKIEFSLITVALNILNLFEKLYSKEQANEVLKSTVVKQLERQKIDILTLLKVKESEIEENIREKSKYVLDLFVKNTPFFTRHAQVDALSASVFGFFQHVIKPELKEHWENLNLPKNFNLITNAEIDRYRESYIDQRRLFLGDKKQLLTPDKFQNLANEAEELRLMYSKEKHIYLNAQKEFHAANKGVPKTLREKQWSEFKFEKFPHLNVQALKVIETRPPSELARIHLADFYGYEEHAMRKLILKSRNSK
jgi:hypothetical protein